MLKTCLLNYLNQLMSLRFIYKHSCNHHFQLACHVTVFTTALYRTCIVPPAELRFDQSTSRNSPPPSVSGALKERRREILGGEKIYKSNLIALCTKIFKNIILALTTTFGWHVM